MALHQAPYDGIIRIRLKGQGNIHPNLSRLLRQHPCGVFIDIIHPCPPVVKTLSFYTKSHCEVICRGKPMKHRRHCEPF